MIFLKRYIPLSTSQASLLSNIDYDINDNHLVSSVKKKSRASSFDTGSDRSSISSLTAPDVAITNRPASISSVSLSATSLLSGSDKDLLDPRQSPRMNFQYNNISMGTRSKSRDANEDMPHLESILEIYTYFEDTEKLPHTAVLRFLVMLVMLVPDVFVELNSQSLEKISRPNIISGKEDTLEKPSNIRQITSGLKKLTTLQLSKKRTVKFLTILVKNINGTQPVSDGLLLDSMRTLLSLVTVTSSVSLIDSEIPPVIFSKRMIDLLGANLKCGSSWKIRPSLTLTNCLKRNPATRDHLRLKYFCAALQFDHIMFLSKLNINKTVESLDLDERIFYTEGFRVFFHLPSSTQLRKEVADLASDFLKNLFCTASDILMEAFPYFNDKITDIISSIVDGTILEEFGTKKLFKESSSSLDASISSTSPSHNSSPSLLSPVSTDQEDNTQQPFLTTSLLARLSDSHSSTGNTSSPSSNTTSIGNATSTTPSATELPFSQSLSQRVPPISKSSLSRNLSGSSQIIAPSPVNISSSMMTLTNSMPAAPGNKTPTPTLTANKLRRYSEESNYNFNGLDIKPVESSVSLETKESRRARMILINIFSIFKKMINYFILPHARNSDLLWISKDFKNIIKPIFVSLIDSDESLQNTARSFMDGLLSYIKDLSSDTSTITVSGYFLICSYTAALFSMGLFDLSIENHKRGVLLDIVVKFLQLRSYLGKVSENTQHLERVLEAERNTFPLILGSVGRATFVSLYVSNPLLQKNLKLAYREYLTAIRFHLKHIGEFDKTFICNVPFIEMMASDTFASAGSVAFQRRVRNNIQKYISQPDSVLLDSMHTIFRKWYSLAYSTNRSEQETIDFRNFAGIIASLSGTFMVLHSGRTEEILPLNEYRQDLKKKMNYFIAKQCEWLNDPKLLTRENSREIISVELHPLSFKLLFNNMKLRLNQVMMTELSGSDEECVYTLLEQLIITIRTILLRDDTGDLLGLFSIDIFEVINLLIIMIKKIPHDSPNYFKTVIHMSKMLKALEHSEGYLALEHHYHLKNRWLRLVVSWFKLAISKDYDLVNLSKSHREMDLKKRDSDFLYIDTAIESSTAIAYLTTNVPLEVPAAASEEEWKRSETVIFGNYFNILLRGLEKSMNSEKFPASLSHKMGMLNENVILALTNISNANIDASLQFTIPMGYSKNRNIKIAFLNVFVNILSQFSSDKEAYEKVTRVMVDKLLLYLIKFPQLVLCAAKVCPANDLDAFAAVVINGMETRNAGHLCVSQLIQDEIKNVSRPMDILRRNSPATRALSLLSRNKANDYLIHCLNPVLQEIVDNKDIFEIEKLDPTEANAGEQIALFKKYMTKLLDAITSSISYFPPEFFFLCQVIYRSTRKKFPNYAYVAAGSFVFLRLICPALVSPETENIIGAVKPTQRRSFITLAKIIQNLANGSENLVKWPSLVTETSFLKECGSRIFDFLTEVCRTDRVIDIDIRTDPKLQPFDFSFLHRFLYTKGVEMRKVLLEGLQTLDDVRFFQDTFKLIDELLGQAGSPKMEYKNEIPIFIRDHLDEYPQLYEFMSRHAFKNHQIRNSIPFVHESMSVEGVPIVTLMFKAFASHNIDMEDVVFKFIQIYSRIWLSKHCFVIDSTEFHSTEVDSKKLSALLSSLIPDVALKNCVNCYLFNTNENFMKCFLSNVGDNPYMVAKIPHLFINSNSDEKMVKSLGLGGRGLNILQDVRVSLHEISVYEEQTKEFSPVTLKIGNKYLQMLHETPRQIKIQGLHSLFDVKFNDVFELSSITAVHVSSITNSTKEFTLNFNDETKLIFSSPKYLEIIKMFYYAQARIENEFNDSDFDSSIISTSSEKSNQVTENNEIIGHLLLVVIIGLYDEDDIVKNSAYNLIAACKDAFGLDFGTEFRNAMELYVPNDTTTFLSLLGNSLAKAHPELTPYMWKYILEGLESKIIKHEDTPQSVCTLSYWISNLYEHVYLMDDEDGPERVSTIFRTLIRLTVADTTVYLNQIWSQIGADDRLIPLLTDEIINHALERDSENRDWQKTISLLTSLPTVEVACNIIQKLLNLIRSFLPSLKQEALTQSWSELMILTKVCSHVFFEAPFMTQMFLPEILFIVSLLIDVGPGELRSLLHELLMNTCHSLSINEALPADSRRNLDEIAAVFSRQKMKFMFGFSQDKGRILKNFSASSFSSKFTLLDYFTTNMMSIMDYSSTTESAQWKTKFRKYLNDIVFENNSFLSARAMMMLGIIGKTYTSESFCRNLLGETMKTVANPVVSDELIFVIISQLFTYSKIVEGLDPSLPLVKEMFWIATIFTESSHPAVFEGGLLFMISCIDRLYMAHFNDSSSVNGMVITELLESRKFAEPLLLKLENFTSLKWSERNFVHIMMAFIIRGLTIPFVHGTALNCLKSMFRNSYYEHMMHPESTDYLNYLFLLYLTLTPDQLSQIQEEVEFGDEVVWLDNNNKISKLVANFLSSDTNSSNISLYQGALLFNNSVTDEPSKVRFILILKYLLQTNSICLLRFYDVVKDEIRKSISFERFSDCVPIIFDIMSVLVLHPKFNDTEAYHKGSVNLLKEKGLYVVSTMKSAEHNFGNLMMGIRENEDLLYKRKKITVMILSRVATRG